MMTKINKFVGEILIKTIDEQRDALRKMPAGELLWVYDAMSKNFNPIDDDFCDVWAMVKVTVIERLDAGRKN